VRQKCHFDGSVAVEGLLEGFHPSYASLLTRLSVVEAVGMHDVVVRRLALPGIVLGLP